MFIYLLLLFYLFNRNNSIYDSSSTAHEWTVSEGGRGQQTSVSPFALTYTVKHSLRMDTISP